MSKSLMRRFTLLFLMFVLMIPSIIVAEGMESTSSQLSDNSNKPYVDEQGAVPVFQNVSVHDPSIVKDGDTFYVFGSHIDAAKSTDLQSWTRFTNGYTTPGNVLYGDLSSNLAGSFAWAGENDSDSKGGFSVWAPDVFWNKDYINKDGTIGAYMMYYCASSTYIRSAIGYAVSKNIEGPYTYGDTVVYSGFTRDQAYDNNSVINKKWSNTNIQALIDSGTLKGTRPEWFNANGSYANSMYPNAIDANLFYDANGKLWMTYGSWSGGIFLLEINKTTGKAIYPGEDGTTADGRLIDRYFGTKIAGGYTKSGEGPYVVYDKNAGYYYLYMTYGWLGADGGYNMRQFRSTSPEGPYVDAQGLNAVLPGNTDNAPYGNKLMSNYLFDRKIGDPGTGIGVGYVSPGHNSVYLDPKTGQQFLVFHTRFPQTGEFHEVRVHQMFMNEKGWPVVAPYRYAGEKLDKVNEQDLIGEYKLINHGKDNSAAIRNSVFIRLNNDYTISGDVNGTWKKTSHNKAEITVDGNTYYGVFVRLWDPTLERYVMTFTAMSNQGVSVWGSKQPNKTDQEIVAAVLNDLNLGETSNVISNLTLPAAGTQNSQITWQSSDSGVITDSGIIHRPEVGSDSVTAVLTATITKGEVTATKSFTITVLPYQAAGLAAHYTFDDNLSDTTEKFGTGTPTGNRIDNSGGTITYADGKLGKAAAFDGTSGVRLPNGLISSNTYSVSLWLKPEQLTMFTTTFFGARDSSNWVSLVPSGPVGGNTMVWSGSRWYDAVAGMTIKTGEWTHLAFSVDNGTIHLYVNGVEKFTGTNFPDIFTVADASFSLGVNWWDTPYKGLMDDLRIYEGALSPQEVANLAGING
ncbi:family 43 glycosylhydrolase [Paenibacillus sp. sptzw28]|uniref:LamG-like jellyroll fold domain-containing protein n=1 Tax=Paenibacillus sp. sptzw28 TaxID=715179 RepID=UPI001C6F0C64|nr:LamG-like jellyroll fold domain-containing protein [Paenibacillus sp. sptzw28]QYR24011.1 family 43 glycosylhydrolase [Paenibacillus sp. sptzw28]